MKMPSNNSAISLRRENLPFNLLLLLLLFAAVPAAAQQDAVPYSATAEKKFRHALQYFDDGAWYSAATHFQQLAVDMPVHQRTTASYLMAGRAHLRSGDPVRCLRLLEELRAQFPQSSYIPESYFTSAEACRAEGSSARALAYYLRAWIGGFGDTALLRARIAAIDVSALPAQDLRHARELAAQLPAGVAEELFPEWAGSARGEHGRPDSETSHATSAAEVEDGRRPVIIAAALPIHLKDDTRMSLVSDLLAGFHAALRQHENDDGYPVELVLFDSMNRDTVSAMIDRLERNPRAVVLIGGAFSEDARIVCEAAGERDMLVLLPTATAEGLTRHGTNIYQLNTPIVDRAELLADFCYLELDAKEVVVLAPEDSYPRRMADAFISRWEEFGLPMRAIHYVTGDAGTLEKGCRSLAADGAKNCILFAPVASKRDIVSVLKGVRSSGITGTVIGGGNWNHPELLRRHAEKLTVYYETDVLPDSSRSELRRLRAQLPALGREHITREMLFGFDAMDLALRLVGNGPITRREARSRIRDVFEGLRAPINFMQTRVNRAMNVLKCVRGEVTQIDSFFAK